MKLDKYIAFTLAETLIVMGIIGVVAALTIPNLNSSTADKEKVAKVKKYIKTLMMQFLVHMQFMVHKMSGIQVKLKLKDIKYFLNGLLNL